jgi:CBS-domain-containing membrane protein
MSEDAVWKSLYAGLLVGVTGLLAWLFGEPLLFPSLGPTAYMYATAGQQSRLSARRVVGGHLVGVLAGLLAYHALAGGVVVTTDASMLAAEQARVAASGVLAVALTTGGMLLTETMHPPACATTLIVSLGLLSSITAGVQIVLAVCILVAAHTLITRSSLTPDAVSVVSS